MAVFFLKLNRYVLAKIERAKPVPAYFTYSQQIGMTSNLGVSIVQQMSKIIFVWPMATKPQINCIRAP